MNIIEIDYKKSSSKTRIIIYTRKGVVTVNVNTDDDALVEYNAHYGDAPTRTISER